MAAELSVVYRFFGVGSYVTKTSLVVNETRAHV